MDFAENVRRQAAMDSNGKPTGEKASLMDQWGFGKYNPLHYNTRGFKQQSVEREPMPEMPAWFGDNVFVSTTKEVSDWLGIVFNKIKKIYLNAKENAKR